MIKSLAAILEIVSNNISAFIAIVVSIISAFFVYKQADAMQTHTTILQKQLELLQEDFQVKNTKEEFTKSFALSQFYISEIIPASETIGLLLNHLKCETTLKKICDHKLLYFDESELQNILNTEERNLLNEIFFGEETLKLDISIGLFALERISPYFLFDFRSSQKSYLDCLKSTHTHDVEGAIQTDLTNTLRALLVYTTNKLEYFSMFFNTNVAEEKVVFASLHQTFLPLVETLYFNIAFRNKIGSQKFYTHTISLYQKWKQKEQELLEEERVKINESRSPKKILSAKEKE